jgi:porphobilinogen deaminase
MCSEGCPEKAIVICATSSYCSRVYRHPTSVSAATSAPHATCLTADRAVDVLVVCGEPVGVSAVFASASSMRSNVTPLELDAKNLREETRRQHCVPDEAEIGRANTAT